MHETGDDTGTDTGGAQLPPGMAAAWGLRQPATRGPKPGLTIDAIVAAAVEIADQSGLSAVSMSRVAERVGFTTMSLYRYVSTKDELIALMVDHALGPPPKTLNADWHRAAEAWARALLGAYGAHPWALDVPITGPPTAPNQLLWLDRLLQSFAGTGLTNQEQLSSALLLDGYTRSWSSLSRGIHNVDSATMAQNAAANRALRDLIDPVRFPALAPMISAGEFEDGDDSPDDFDEVFDFSLERIIAGIDVLVQARAAAG
jgi:AcrR family transcriptional regulator